MRWRGRRTSSNVDDRRPRVGKRGVAAGGAGAIIMALIAVFVLGQDPATVLQQVVTQSSTGTTQQRTPSAAEDEVAEMSKVVLATTEDVWNALFQQAGSRYAPPTLVLFTDSTPTGCGFGSAATGPFYCPADQKLYIDLSFLSQLRRMGAEGDFALAYVIAHEVGHHIQTITGTSRQVRQAQQRANQVQKNALQVRMELQADCYAGVWAHYARRDMNLLERGDLEEGLRAAAAVGDDTLQRNAGRRVQPETFTHGSSQQRMEWFQRGVQTGAVSACDTFGG
ncbi:MAG: neutral zinc metallopeptidase [Pseudomonadota bacterium]